MIKEYQKKDGSKAYLFVAYLGVDPLTGKQRRTTRRGFKTKRDAKIAEARLQTEIENNGFSAPQKQMTFQEAYEGWLEQYKLTVKESSLAVVTSLISKGILPLLGHLAVNKITLRQCQKLVNDWHKNYATFRKYKTYASQIMDYAVISGAIHDNPFKKVKMPRSKDNSCEEHELYYTKDELRTFLSFVEQDTMYYAIFRTLAFTGIRKGELQALQWKDIDFDKMTLSVSKTLTYGLKQRPIINSPKTKKSNRIISIDDGTAHALKKWKIEQQTLLFQFGFKANNKEQFIFTNIQTNQLLSKMTISHKLWSICETHQFKKIKLHGLRHTCCSLLFEAGIPLHEVQERLGHSNIKTTMDIYTHVTQKQRDTSAERFAKYLNF